MKQGVIMAGGFGTRLKELTEEKEVPKPLLKLQGKPIMEYSMELLKRYDIKEIAISIHHIGHKIKDRYGEGKDFGVSITYFEEDEPLGTAGALRLYKDWFTGAFFMCNADELKDVNLHEMWKLHKESGASATIALTKVEDPSQYGVVDMEGKKIKKFVEKPPKGEAPSNLISAGLYIIEKEVLDSIPEGYAMVEKDVFPHLASEGKLYGFVFDGQWFDTGTPERYATAEKNWQGFSEVETETVEENEDAGT